MVAKRNIVYEGDECLRKKSRPVEKFDQRLWTLLDDMAETMYAANGVGLAAPQVGILRRAVVIDVGDGLIELINPEILSRKGKQVGNEGCLSCPGETGTVERPKRWRCALRIGTGNGLRLPAQIFWPARFVMKPTIWRAFFSKILLLRCIC